ncbi:hypothetical protein ES705_27693 [subsurface metagenome]
MSTLKEQYSSLEEGAGKPMVSGDESEIIKELEIEINVWKEKYSYLKEMSESKQQVQSEDNSELILDNKNTIIELEAEVKKYKGKKIRPRTVCR